MTPQDVLASAGVAVAVFTVVVTVIVARHGWKRDRDHRDASLEAECVTSMCMLIQARYAPLAGGPWTQFDGATANEHHTTAIASMNAVSASRQDHDLLRFVSRQAIAIQEESVRYRRGSDYRHDVESSVTGPRRAAIFAAATLLQEDLLLWQQRGSTDHIRSFWSRYADHLLDPSLVA